MGQTARGIAFTALDNGFAACEDQAALADICQSLCASDVRAFFDRWQATPPSPFSAQDRRRGYGYELAFRQLEISDTRVFDRPGAGRAWFEKTLPDQLTLGRPDQVAVVFGRRVSRRTPGRFHTKVITRGVEPAIQAHYRASKVKQYFKDGRALRTETTVNDTRDFGIGRMLTAENWDALIGIGHQINRACLTTSLTRANARLTPRRLSAWCCHPNTMAYPPRTAVRRTPNDGAAGVPAPISTSSPG